MARELARERTAGGHGALYDNRSLLRTLIAAVSLGGDASLLTRQVSTLTVVGEEDAASTFEATVSEYIVPTPIPGEEDAPEPAGPAVEDAVSHERRRYVFTGDLLDLRVDGPATVRVDGERVEPSAVDR